MYTISDKRRAADWAKAKEKARTRPPTVCLTCGAAWTPIYTTPLVKGQYKSTCSIECTKEFQRKQGSASFAKLWEDRVSMIEKASSAGRRSAACTVRRSKDEIALYDMCYKAFKNVSHNSVIVDGWDADIIIEDFKLAVLWNGPWHYTQMPHRNHSLSQVQNRDRIKVRKLTAVGYTVVIYEDRHYTPMTAFNDIVKKFAAGCDGSTKGS